MLPMRETLEWASYIMGEKNGYASGYIAGKVNVELDGTLNFADDGNGNITITEAE